MIYENQLVDPLKYYSQHSGNTSKVNTMNKLSNFHNTFSNVTSNQKTDRKLQNMQVDKLIDYIKNWNNIQIEEVSVPNNYKPTALCEESPTIPDYIQVIVNKAWSVCKQENKIKQNENYLQKFSHNGGDHNRTINFNEKKSLCECILSLDKVLNKKLNIDHTVTAKQNDEIFLTSPRASSPDSGLGCDQGQNDLEINNMHFKPRPLLRQKECIQHEVVKLSCEKLLTLTNNEQHQLLHRPMQVHMRYPIPRKQDAIYNTRYKTQPCLHYQKNKRCPLGDNCHFAHGPEELKHPQLHPKYRTRICMNYVQTGNCPFGQNCYFLHTALPMRESTSNLYIESILSSNQSSINIASSSNLHDITQDSSNNLRRVTL